MVQTERELPQVAGEAVLASGFAGGADPAAPPSDLPVGGRILALLVLESVAFALAGASGKMPEVVVWLFRALLTL
ncbi:MAG TPA: hypothetical protein VLH41_08630 [Thermoanaerobaculia bacterium]|nr:hypothetical protein [Thermoanaerobaculia bacterium]